MERTPKEEAKNLVDEFKKELKDASPSQTGYWKFKTQHASKQCALLCVDKLSERTSYDFAKGVIEENIHKISQERYIEIKQEIRKL